jgi:hypothetical protein
MHLRDVPLIHSFPLSKLLFLIIGGAWCLFYLRHVLKVADEDALCVIMTKNERAIRFFKILCNLFLVGIELIIYTV